jgi:hypothetical protein
MKRKTFDGISVWGGEIPEMTDEGVTDAARYAKCAENCIFSVLVGYIKSSQKMAETPLSPHIENAAILYRTCPPPPPQQEHHKKKQQQEEQWSHYPRNKKEMTVKTEAVDGRKDICLSSHRKMVIVVNKEKRPLIGEIRTCSIAHMTNTAIRETKRKQTSLRILDLAKKPLSPQPTTIIENHDYSLTGHHTPQSSGLEFHGTLIGPDTEEDHTFYTMVTALFCGFANYFSCQNKREGKN